MYQWERDLKSFLFESNKTRSMALLMAKVDTWTTHRRVISSWLTDKINLYHWSTAEIWPIIGSVDRLNDRLMVRRWVIPFLLFTSWNPLATSTTPRLFPTRSDALSHVHQNKWRQLCNPRIDGPFERLFLEEMNSMFKVSVRLHSSSHCSRGTNSSM